MELKRISTEATTERERVAFWAEIVCSTFVELDCRISDGKSFHGEIEKRVNGGFDFAYLSSTTQRVDRTRARISQSNCNDYLLNLQLKGKVRVCQDGREAVLNAGDFAIYDTTRPYNISASSDFGGIVLRLPRQMVGRSIAEIAHLTAQTIDGSRGIGRIASTFIQQIGAQIVALPVLSLPRLHTNTLDLISSAFAERSGRGSKVPNSHILIRRRATAFIDQSFMDPCLSCESVAAAVGISARHMRAAFGNSPSSVAELIRARRLEEARRILADPLCAHISVTSVGYDVGFKDPAHFSRAFKGTFKITPSAFRSTAICGLQREQGRTRTAD